MPTLELTKRVIDSLPHSKEHQQLYFDVKQKGFGLRISADTKTYFVQKNVNGRTRRVTIGKHGVFTLEQARKEAIQLLADMTRGVDPNLVKREKKMEVTTLLEAFESRIKAKSAKLGAFTVRNYRRIVRQHLCDWQNRSLQDITKTMIMHRYGEITRKYGPDAATRAMRVFSVTYNYARYLNTTLPENPVVILSLTKSWHPAKRRQRVVKAHQLADWFKAVMGEENDTMRNFLLFLLFTGMRRNEAAKLRWEDVDFGGNTITLCKTKNGHSHVLPLETFIKDMLQKRYQNKVNSYVFHGASAEGHLKDPKKAIKRVVDICGFEFSSHDLRRTFITTAESLDVSLYAIKYLINHRTNNDLTGGYMVLDIERMRPPMRRIEEKLLELMKYEGKTTEPKTETTAALN